MDKALRLRVASKGNLDIDKVRDSLHLYQRMKQEYSDILGLAILDVHRGHKSAPVKVWMNGQREGDYQADVFLRSYRQLLAWEKTALKLAKGSVLDVGAGAGTHSLILQKRNFDVTAIEISPLCSEVMRERGVQQVINENVFNLKGIEYNTILLMMNGLGMAGTEAETLRLFKHLKRLLAKGGQIIGDSTDILYARMNAMANFESNGKFYGEVEFQLSYKNKKGTPFHWLYLDPVLLAELSDKAGLKAEIIHRDKDFHYLARLTRA
ncbi:MAG: class I SAM-dependent methyltransferase [Flavobacteriales bacterium]